MDVTAKEIAEKQFHDSWRGYNQEEVDDFLDRISETLTRLERENASLHERLREVDQMLETSRSTEEMLKKTLLTAQQAAEEAIMQAKAKAEELVADAEERAERAREELKRRVETAEEEVRRRTADAEERAERRQDQLQVSIDRLQSLESAIRDRLSAFLRTQLEAVEHLGGQIAADEAPVTETSTSEPPVAEQQASRVAEPASRLHATVSPRLGARHADDELPGQRLLEDHDSIADFGPLEEPEPRRRALRGIFRRDQRDEEDFTESG